MNRKCMEFGSLYHVEVLTLQLYHPNPPPPLHKIKLFTIQALCIKMMQVTEKRKHMVSSGHYLWVEGGWESGCQSGW